LQNQTQTWALIGALFGAIVGFFLSLLAMGITNKRNYKKLLNATIIKIVSYIRDNNVPVAIQAISEIEASFREQDQLRILERASLESSLNASSNRVTGYILDKFEWMTVNEALCSMPHGLPWG
jgi:glutaminase